MDKSNTTTFYRWLNDTSVEIPMLQRDYAQGRDDPKTTTLRKQFVRDLIVATPDKPVHLDFIYGPKHDGIFQPLDGQQRLTTLFLLHWYLAVKADKLELKEVKGTLKKFRYKVRVSTQEFITALLIPDNVKDEELSKNNLKDAKWYFSSWDYDPSIQGMLNMIDTIHSTITEINIDCSNLWKTLSDGDAPITFTVLNMEKFGLGDELYMRMNARGLALSSFENFKAWLHGQCEDQASRGKYFSKPQDVSTINKEHWGYKLDREWSFFFWEKSKKENKEGPEKKVKYDPKVMNDTFLRFFQLATLNAYAARYNGIDIEGKSEEAKLCRDNISRLADGKDYIPNEEYQKTYKLLCGETLEELFILFDFLSEDAGEKWLKETLEPVPFFFKERDTPIDLLYKGKLTYPQRVLFHALQRFITQDGFKRESEEHKKAFTAWMRVIRNLVLNSTIDAPANFVRAIKSVDNLFEKAATKNAWLNYLADDNNDVGGFSTDQIAEERLKAKLMIGAEAVKWDQMIVDAENHSLFRGQIGFLFQDADPFDSKTRVAELGFARVQRRWENAALFFTNSGIAEPFAKDSILMRAYISRMTKWKQLWHIPFGNGTYTWREVILKVKEGESEKLAPLLSLLEIVPINPLEQLKEWINEDSKIADLNIVTKRVHHDLYRTSLLAFAEDQSYLKGWDNDLSLSRYIYHLMPYNAKADWKKVVIGTKRNKVLAELIENKEITTNNQLANGLPFFRRSSVSFNYNEIKYRWDWHDQIYLEGKEEPLVLRKQGMTEEILTGKKILELLNGFTPFQQAQT